MSFSAEGSVSGKLTFKPSATTTDYTITFPQNVGTTGQVLSSIDNNGTLQWSTFTTSASGSNQDIQFNKNGQLGSDTSFTYNDTTKTISLDSTDIISNSGDFIIDNTTGHTILRTSTDTDSTSVVGKNATGERYLP